MTRSIGLFLSVQLDISDSVTTLMGGHRTMACLSGKGHGKMAESVAIRQRAEIDSQHLTRATPAAAPIVVTDLQREGLPGGLSRVLVLELRLFWLSGLGWEGLPGGGPEVACTHLISNLAIEL